MSPEQAKIVIDFINLLLSTKFGDNEQGIFKGAFNAISAAGWEIAALDTNEEGLITNIYIIEKERK